MGLIRFLLACGVVLCHTSSIEGYTPLSGNLAVQCFYIISGFYMAMILTEKYKGDGSTYLFYTNRMLRIYPIYWLNLVLLIMLNYVAYRLHYPSVFDFYLKYQQPTLLILIYFILANLFIIGLDWFFLFGINKSGTLFFTPDFNRTSPNVYNYAFNGIAWTVGLELLFYLIVPWLNKRKWQVLSIIAVASLALRIVLGNLYGDVATWNYMFFPTQVFLFIGGMFSYKLYVKLKNIKLIKSIKWGLYLWLVLIVLFYYQFFSESYYKNLILFLSFALVTPLGFDLFKTSKTDRFLGNISYPIYISQGLFIHITSIKRVPKIWGTGFTTLVLVIIFSIIVDKVLSVYIERVRARRISNFKKQAALSD